MLNCLHATTLNIFFLSIVTHQICRVMTLLFLVIWFKEQGQLIQFLRLILFLLLVAIDKTLTTYTHVISQKRIALFSINTELNNEQQKETMWK